MSKTNSLEICRLTLSAKSPLLLLYRRLVTLGTCTLISIAIQIQVTCAWKRR